MKNSIFILITIFSLILCLEIRGSYNNTKAFNEANSEKAISAIFEVLKNNRQFYCGEDGRLLYLKDYNSSNYLYLTDDTQLAYTLGNGIRGDYSFVNVCIQDIDSDKIPEIILETNPSGDIFLFSYKNGSVYEFTFPYRGIKELKQDGSFLSSGASSNIYIGRLRFIKSKYKYEELCVFDATEENDIQYRIDGKKSTFFEVETYIEDFHRKEEALWIEYEDFFSRYSTLKANCKY